MLETFPFNKKKCFEMSNQVNEDVAFADSGPEQHLEGNAHFKCR